MLLEWPKPDGSPRSVSWFRPYDGRGRVVQLSLNQLPRISGIHQLQRFLRVTEVVQRKNIGSV